MIGAVCHALGPAESLVIGEIAVRHVDVDDVLIEVEAAAVNFPDNLIIKGEYQVRPPIPFVPGFEVAGVVRDVGEEVTRFAVGDRVMGLTKGGWGGYAQLAVARSDAVEIIPDRMSSVMATAYYSSYSTAYYALRQRGRIEERDTVVILGAAGGVGLAAIEVAKSMGARVIAVAGNQEKLDVTRAHGADEVINYKQDDLRNAVYALTSGRGADVCLDTVGGDAFDAMSRVMAQKGRLLIVGFASGRIPQIPANLLLLKGYEVVGVYWNSFVDADPDAKRRNSERLAQLWNDGALNPLVAKEYPLEQVADALHDIAGRSVIGKLVMTFEDLPRC